MILSGSPFAESTLAGVVGGTTAFVPDPPAPTDIPINPYTVEISGVRVAPLIDSLSIESELGRQGTANFTLVNISTSPVVGEPVRILFNEDLIFAGMIDRVNIESNNTMTFKTHSCECVDYSYLLFRRKISKSYTNVQWIAIALDAMFNIIPGDAITLGYIDPLATNAFIPIVDAKEVSLHDVLSEAASVIGAIFYIDYTKHLNLITAEQLPSAPIVLDGSVVEHATMSQDREAYRNLQTVTITGTTTSQAEQPITVTYTRQNTEQIAARQAIEGGAGVYNDFESITHPTSNSIVELQKLAVAFAQLRLGVTGSLRQTLSIRTRALGLLAGQQVVVDLPQLGVTTAQTWYIQKSSVREVSGRYAVTTLELSSSTLTRRAQELWLEIVKRGKLIVMPPVLATPIVEIQSETFASAGTTSWTVPSSVLQVQVSCYGAGGGGAGGAVFNDGAAQSSANGGVGGFGGLGISVFAVTPGETLTIVVGAKGTAGVSSSKTNPATLPVVGTNGSTGGTSSIKRGGTVLCSATGGLGGTGPTIGYVSTTVGLYSNYIVRVTGHPGSVGIGLGQVNTNGGGMFGGGPGKGSPFAQPSAAIDGKVIIEY